LDFITYNESSLDQNHEVYHPTKCSREKDRSLALHRQHDSLEREAKVSGNPIPEHSTGRRRGGGTGGKDRMLSAAIMRCHHSREAKRAVEMVGRVGTLGDELSLNSNLHLSGQAWSGSRNTRRQKSPVCANYRGVRLLLLPELLKDPRKHFSQLVH
jgi:hypothetical protein